MNTPEFKRLVTLANEEGNEYKSTTEGSIEYLQNLTEREQFHLATAFAKELLLENTSEYKEED